MKIIWILLLSWCLFSAYGESTGSLKDILSGNEKIASISERTLKSGISEDVHRLRSWWTREKESVEWLLFGTVLVLGAVSCGFLLVRRYRSGLSGKRKLSWHLELFLASSPPVLVLTGLFGLLFFFLPVLRSLPDFYTCDIRVFFSVATLCAAWIGMEVIGVFSRRMTAYAQNENSNLDQLMVEISRKLLKIILIVITAAFIGQRIFGLNITALLTGAGVLGLAVAFASKETLSNFFGTVVIISDKPFRCGDRVQIGGIDGIVSAVGMRSTRIRTANETTFIIPNSSIESANVENISRRGVISYSFTVGLSYESSAEQVEKAIELLHRIADNFHGPDSERCKPRIFFDSLGDSALNLKVIMWLKTSSYAQEELWRTELNTAVLKQFAEAGLVMAYRSSTHYLYGDENHPLRIVSRKE